MFFWFNKDYVMKIKLLTIIMILLCSLCNSAIAQSEGSKSKFYLGVFVSSDLSYRILVANSDDDKRNTQLRNQNEIPKLLFTSGVESLFQFKPQYSISLGLQYSLKGIQTREMDYESGKAIDPRRGFVYQYEGVGAKKLKINYYTQYFTIPIRLDYYILQHKHKLFVSAGVSANILISNSEVCVYTYDNGHKERVPVLSHHDYYSFNPQAQLGIGYDIMLKRNRFRVIPIYCVSLTKINKDNIREYFHSIGLGLNYFFGI